MGRVKRIRYLSPMRAAKVQASLRIRAVSPKPPLLAHTSSESRRTFRQKVRSLAPLNGWACAVKICHDRMLEDTNSLDAPHIIPEPFHFFFVFSIVLTTPSAIDFSIIVVFFFFNFICYFFNVFFFIFIFSFFHIVLSIFEMYYPHI